MEVPTGAPDFNIDESNTEPVMDGAWDPVLRRIEELASAGLHTTTLLADFIWRRLAPLRENPKRFWAYSGTNDSLRITGVKPSLGQVADFLRGCISPRSADRIGMPDHLRALFESPSVLPEVLLKMPWVDTFGLLGDTRDLLKAHLAPAVASTASAAAASLPAPASA